MDVILFRPKFVTWFWKEVALVRHLLNWWTADLQIQIDNVCVFVGFDTGVVCSEAPGWFVFQGSLALDCSELSEPLLDQLSPHTNQNTPHTPTHTFLGPARRAQFVCKSMLASLFVLLLLAIDKQKLRKRLCDIFHFPWTEKIAERKGSWVNNSASQPR